MLAPITNDVPVIAPPLIAPLVVKPSEPKLIVVTPVPVATATVLAVVSKSKVRFSLLPADFWPAKVSTPLVAEMPTPVVAPMLVVLESMIEAGRVEEMEGTPAPLVTRTPLLPEVKPAIVLSAEEQSIWFAVVVVGRVAVDHAPVPDTPLLTINWLAEPPVGK